MAREPVRSCVGCRARATKAELLRIARTTDGVRPDPAGTVPGRGAYVHRDPACVESALRARSFARALRTGMDQDEVVRLRGLIEEELQER